MVLIQEMDVKVDMGFLMALMGLFSSDAIDRSQEVSVQLCGGGISISVASRVVVRLIILAFVLTTPIAWSSIYC